MGLEVSLVTSGGVERLETVMLLPQMTVVQLTLHQSSNFVSLIAARLILCLPGQAVRILEVCHFSSTENFIAPYGTYLTPSTF